MGREETSGAVTADGARSRLRDRREACPAPGALGGPERGRIAVRLGRLQRDERVRGGFRFVVAAGDAKRVDEHLLHERPLPLGKLPLRHEDGEMVGI